MFHAKKKKVLILVTLAAGAPIYISGVWKQPGRLIFSLMTETVDIYVSIT